MLSVFSAKRGVKNLGYAGLFYGGVVPLAKYLNRHKPRILVYHSIAPQESDFTRGIDVTVTPATFEQQIRRLKTHYTVLSLRDLVALIRDGKTVENGVSITFDDGYRDTYTNAWPILKKYQVPATVFVNTNVLDNQGFLWMHEFLYLAHRVSPAKLGKLAEAYLEINGLVEGNSAGDRLWNLLNYFTEHVPESRTTGFFQHVYDKLALPPPNPASVQLYLSWDQIEEMTEGGVTFGNHNSSHANLRLLDEAEQRSGIECAKAILVKKLGLQQVAFAYPYGEPANYDDAIRQMAVDSGHYCVLSGSGNLIDVGTPVDRLDRIGIKEEPFWQFAARIERFSIRRSLQPFAR